MQRPDAERAGLSGDEGGNEGGAQAPRWSSSRRWLVLAGVLGPLLFSVLLGGLCAFFAQDLVFGFAYFLVVALFWVVPRALVWRITVVGTALEHEDGVLSVLDLRGDVQRTVDLESVERLEVIRGALLPNMAGKHTFSTAVAHWRDADAEPAEVVRTYVPFPDDFDAMLAFLREAAEGTGAEVLDVTHGGPAGQAPDAGAAEAAKPAAVTG